MSGSSIVRAAMFIVASLAPVAAAIAQDTDELPLRRHSQVIRRTRSSAEAPERSHSFRVVRRTRWQQHRVRLRRRRHLHVPSGQRRLPRDCARTLAFSSTAKSRSGAIELDDRRARASRRVDDELHRTGVDRAADHVAQRVLPPVRQCRCRRPILLHPVERRRIGRRDVIRQHHESVGQDPDVGRGSGHREEPLHFANGLDRFDAVPAGFLLSGGNRKGQAVENDVALAQPEFCVMSVIAGCATLPFIRCPRLAFLVTASTITAAPCCDEADDPAGTGRARPRPRSWRS